MPGSPAPIVGEQFTLSLRFRYYPKKREFVKTAITAHQLYLQLRQDMLNGALQFQNKEKALEMAVCFPFFYILVAMKVNINFFFSKNILLIFVKFC